VHIRLTLTRGVKVTSGMDPRLNVSGPTLIVLAEFKDPVYDQSGISLITSSVRRHAPDSLDPKIHHNNLLTSILAKIEANVAGADDAVMLDSRGFIAETNATHLFMVFPGSAPSGSGSGAAGVTLATPTTVACPEGITRETVLRLVGIDAVHLKSFPHQLSGGMRQRAMIAMALLFTPDLVIMDEPTSALDVVAQRSLMVQIKELQQQLGFAVVFVTHDMSLVSHFSDRLMVMYAGQVAEAGATRKVFDAPKHPYSVGLLDAFPSIRGPKVPLTGIPGRPPDLARPPEGCRFAPRCPKVMDRCTETVPDLFPVDGVDVRCLLYDGSSDE